MEILVVEDDRGSRTTLVDILEVEGYQVTGVENGLEALEQLQGRPLPCLILLDLMLPVMDGWEFRGRQLQDPELAEIPVVVMSGVHDDNQQALALEAAAYFLKPYNVKTLLAMVARFCRPDPIPSG